MVICSFVIEQRAKETTWRVRPIPQAAEERGFNIMWLQQVHEVNDQQFDSYALFASGTRFSILTSRSRSSATAPCLPPSENRAIRLFASVLALVLKSLSRFKPIKPNKEASFLRVIFEVCATYGAIVSISGFVIQFIGLRGMHWSATIAQLVATLLMVALRAWVRRNLAYRPSDQEVTQGHELDWLAVRLVGDLAQQQRLWSNQSATHPAKVEHTDDLWTVHCWNWSRIPACGSDSYRILNPSAEPEELTTSTADKVVRVRQRLGLLSNRTTSVSEPAVAVAVAKAIEMVMDTLWDPTRSPETLFLRQWMQI
jgi:hypothetical protein